MIQMKNDGFIEREWQAHLQETGDHNCVAQVDSSSSADDDTFSLGIPEMAGIFIIHAMLMGLAVIVAILHHYRMRRQHESQRHLSSSSKVSGNAATFATNGDLQQQVDGNEMNHNAHASVTFADQAFEVDPNDISSNAGPGMMEA